MKKHHIDMTDTPLVDTLIDSVEMNLLGENFGNNIILPTLQEAAEKGDSRSVTALLSETDHEVNEWDHSGLSALHKATKQGHTEVILALAKHSKFDIDVLSKEGSAAIHLSVKHRRIKCMELLLNRGADLNKPDAAGKTALHLAARKSHTQIVQIILKHPRVNVNVESKDKTTPLHAAVHNGSHEICELLINAGANVHKQDIGKQTPLILAALEQRTDVLRLIIDAARKFPATFPDYLHHKDNEGSTAVHLAVLNKRYDSLKILLEAGAQVNDLEGQFYCVQGQSLSDDNTTPLHIAAIFGFHEITSLLLEHGADVFCRTTSKQTPLHKAALFDTKTECAELLVSKEADVNAADKEEMTPLHCAVQAAHLNMIKFLLAKGAIADQADDRGRTILHFAVQSQNIECLDLLVDLIPQEVFRKTLQSQDVDEMTPLHHCAKEGRLDLLVRLLELGSSAADKDEMDRTPIHLAAEKGYTHCVEKLFAHSKTEISSEDSEGRTPMLLACLHGHYNCVRALIRFGGDFNVRSRSELRHSPLTLAASEGHYHLVDLLLDNGGCMFSTTKFSDTALHLACRGNHVRVVKLLLDKSANVAARNVNNETPLDAAIESRSVESADAIIKSDRWEEAMKCLDANGINPFPRLVTFLPDVAKTVLDNCVTREGNPEADDFAVTYNFKYIDPHPKSKACRNGKAWYVNDIAEYGCVELLTHEVVSGSMACKWKKFANLSFLTDLSYFLFMVVLLSTFIATVPKHMTDYLDKDSCPMMPTDEEINNKTMFDELYERGTPDRFDRDHEKMKAVNSLKILSFIVIIGTLIRLIIGIVYLRHLLFQKFTTYLTMIMAGCVLVTILGLDSRTLVICTYHWRTAWIGMLLSWTLLATYMSRLAFVGLYISMFAKVCESIVKAMVVLGIFLLAFAFCFYITLHPVKGFSTPELAFLSVFDMALGELSYVDRFLTDDKGPFYIDNLILIAIFMVIVPVALMNLLIGIAVGDIDAVRKESSGQIIRQRIKTIDEYGRYAIKWFQLRWYEDHATVYPNIAAKTFVARWYKAVRNLKSRSIYKRSKGWEYKSQLQPVVDTVEELAEKLDQSHTKLIEMQMKMEQQNEWMRAIAAKVGAEVDKRGTYVN